MAMTAPAYAASNDHSLPASLDDNATRMTDIHDIKPPLEMGVDPAWLYWMAGILALLALIYLGWRLWRRREKATHASPAPTPVAPDVQACQALDALAADDSVDAKQFYFRLSAILRRYIEARYTLPAAEMTTEELLPRIDGLTLPADLVQPLKTFCRATEPIKFAGSIPAPEGMARDLAFAREFVRRSAAIQEAAGQAGDTAPAMGRYGKYLDQETTE